MTSVLLCVVLLIIDMAIVLRYRENYVRAVILLSCVYLISLTIAQEMDLTFTVYFVFLFLVLLDQSKGVSKLLLCYGIYMVLYAVYGMIFQETMNTASVLITRYGFLLLALLQIDMRLPKSFRPVSDLLFALRMGTATEIILSIYLFFFGDLEGRLTMNHHAIGGSLSVGLVVLCIVLYFYDQNLWQEHFLWLYLLVNVAIILLSGTRGYYAMAGLTLIPFAGCFLMDRRHYRFRWMAAAVLGFLLCGLMLFAFDPIWEYVVSVLRLDESVGYRVYENDFIKSLYSVEPWYHKLFGFGLGGRADHLPETLGIAWQASQGNQWMAEKLLTETTCHNYWYTVLFKQGILGLFFVVIILFTVFRRTFCRQSETGLRNSALFFGVGILISLTYRISSTCGVFEMMVFIWSAEIVTKEES